MNEKHRIEAMVAFFVVLLIFLVGVFLVNYDTLSYGITGMAVKTAVPVEDLDNELLVGFKILIDPLYGGAESGVAKFGFREKDVLLDVAKLMKSQLEETGADVELTRESDIGLTEQERMEKLTNYNPDLFVRLSLKDSSNLSVRGASMSAYCFCAENKTHHNTAFCDVSECEQHEFLASSIKMGLSFMASLTEKNGIPVETGSAINSSDLQLLYRPSLLLQLGYLSNSVDRDFLTTSRSKIYADAIVDAVKKIKEDKTSIGRMYCDGANLRLLKGSLAKECAQYLDIYEKYFDQYAFGDLQIDPVLILALSLQESGCNNGASCEGIMQVKYPCGIYTDPDYCKCKTDPDFAVNKGIEEFITTIQKVRSYGITGDDAITLTLFGYNRGQAAMVLAAQYYKQGMGLFDSMLRACNYYYDGIKNSKTDAQGNNLCTFPGHGIYYPEKIFEKYRVLCDELGGKVLSSVSLENSFRSSVQYKVEPSAKVQFNYELIDNYQEEIDRVDKLKQDIRTCLEQGSDKAGDDDVITCAARAGVVGIDDVGHYYLEVSREDSISVPIIGHVQQSFSVAPLMTGAIVRPTNGPITNPYGRYSRGYRCNSRHIGVDYGGGTGTPVYAAVDGVVYKTSNSCNIGSGEGGGSGYGRCIKLKHERYDGTVFYTFYAHLSQIAVSVGEPVIAGTRIGAIGNTGRSFGHHLHFEYREGPIGGYCDDARNPCTNLVGVC